MLIIKDFEIPRQKCSFLRGMNLLQRERALKSALGRLFVPRFSYLSFYFFNIFIEIRH
jgi:hypothetical protein